MLLENIVMLEFASHNPTTKRLKAHNSWYYGHHNDMNEIKKEHKHKRGVGITKKINDERWGEEIIKKVDQQVDDIM